MKKETKRKKEGRKRKSLLSKRDFFIETERPHGLSFTEAAFSRHVTVDSENSFYPSDRFSLLGPRCQGPSADHLLIADSYLRAVEQCTLYEIVSFP